MYHMDWHKFGIDIFGSQMMDPNDCGDPLTFHLAPSSGQTLHVSSTLVYDQISTKLMTFPSASAVLCVSC